jgi:predicted oxidoreductase (fatty acid repression mutant protein)
MVHSINANNNSKLSKFALYFHLGSVHAHIILWINDVDVDCIMSEIVTMVPAFIDEQSKKFILPDNEHDLTLFKLVERKQMHQCGSQCKTNKHIRTCKYGFPTIIFAKQHAVQHPITQRWVKKIQIKCDF